MPHNSEQNTKTKTPSFQVELRKFRKLWEQIFHRQRDEIKTQREQNEKLLRNFNKLEPSQSNFKKLGVRDDDFSPIVRDITPDGELSLFRVHKNWEVVFENLDINLIPYIRTEIVYDQGGNTEGQLEFRGVIGEGENAVEIDEGVRFFNRNRMFQVEDIPDDRGFQLPEFVLPEFTFGPKKVEHQRGFGAKVNHIIFIL